LGKRRKSNPKIDDEEELMNAVQQTMQQQARVIFSTGSLYLLDLAHCFELAAEAGFDGIEVMCDTVYSSRDPIYLQTLSERYDLPVFVVHTPFVSRLPGWERPDDEVARIQHTLQLAETLGAETIVVHVPRKYAISRICLGKRRLAVPRPSSRYKPVKNWIQRELSDVQQKTPVKIALENLPAIRIAGRAVDPTWWNEVDTWSRVHDWLTLDTTHWATKGVDALEAYAVADSRVCHIHLSNYDGREHRLPHRGHLDLGAFLRRLGLDGFTGTVCNELHPDALEYQNDVALRHHLKDSVAFCREHLEHATQIKLSTQPLSILEQQ
jgi:sugar phosphate isomerase/epimerase